MTETSDSPQLVGIEACVFDAYGTLFDISTPARRFRDKLGDQWDDLSTLWREKQLQYTWLRSLMGDFEDFWHVTGESLDYAMEALGIDDALLRAQLMEQYFGLDPYPEVSPTLQTLKTMGKRRALLSNGSTSMLAAGVTSAELRGLLDAVLSVDTVSVFKPHPSTYQMAIDHFEVTPEQVCFVSSNPWDVAGAGRFGFQAIWVKRANLPVEKIGTPPRAIITSLADLPPLLSTPGT